MTRKSTLFDMIRKTNESVGVLLDISQMARERIKRLEERVEALEEAAHKHP